MVLFCAFSSTVVKRMRKNLTKIAKKYRFIKKSRFSRGNEHRLILFAEAIADTPYTFNANVVAVQLMKFVADTGNVDINGSVKLSARTP